MFLTMLYLQKELNISKDMNHLNSCFHKLTKNNMELRNTLICKMDLS